MVKNGSARTARMVGAILILSTLLVGCDFISDLLDGGESDFIGPPGDISMIAPFTDLAAIEGVNEAYSDDPADPAPWGFEHRGIDFFPTGRIGSSEALFVSAASGEVTELSLRWNDGNGFWQVNVSIRYNTSYEVGCAFEPMTADRTDGETQLDLIGLSLGQRVSQGTPIGRLLKAGDGAHVHFGLSRNGEWVCPEPYFTTAARQTVLDAIHKTYPGAAMCY